MPHDYTVVALVSGKGGVGKTTIATNLAFALAAGGNECMLIDVDFQNLGCTGLFEARWELPKIDALTLLRDCPSCVVPDIIEVAAKLRFLPATFRFPNTDAFLDSSDEIARRLRFILDVLAPQFKTSVFVLDCHGAVDSMSIAAAGAADHTVVVTEPDTVTFAGTLELIESYYAAYEGGTTVPQLAYVVNRIPPKYRWHDLNDLYNKHLPANHHKVATDAVVVFIPTESYLAESFGEYPFQVKLAPRSLFADKIALLVHQLDPYQNEFRLSQRGARIMKSSRLRARIVREIVSREAANVRAVFVGFSVGGLWMLLLTTLYLGVARKIISHPQYTRILEGIVLAMFFLLAGFYLPLMLRIVEYFRDRYSFESALAKALPGPEGRWRRVRLWRLRALLVGAAVGAAIGTMLVVGVLVVGVVAVVRNGS
jgi:MinD-like ATPase involved in chromosome partitioning or flagellar assembly